MFFNKPHARFSCKVQVYVDWGDDFGVGVEEVSVRQWLSAQTHLQSGALSAALLKECNQDSHAKARHITVKITEEATGKVCEVARIGDCHINDVNITAIYQSAPECIAPKGDDEPLCLPALKQWALPHLSLLNVWESLHYDDDDAIKTQLLHYAQASITLSEYNVSRTMIQSSRLIILHGPPGVGKVSLCRGLAQELTWNRIFPFHYLVEVNAAALLAYSLEAGKTVSKVFQHIARLAEEEADKGSSCGGEFSTFVCVFFDEAETLFPPRQSAASSGENRETLRVVNAMLTQLYALMMRPNVLVVCATHLLSALDPEFVDRADLVLNLGFPGDRTRRKILVECLDELLDKNIIDNRSAKTMDDVSGTERPQNSTGGLEEYSLDHSSKQMDELLNSSSGCSARQLRKLPLHGFAKLKGVEGVKMTDFIKAMTEHLEEHKRH